MASAKERYLEKVLERATEGWGGFAPPADSLPEPSQRMTDMISEGMTALSTPLKDRNPLPTFALPSTMMGPFGQDLERFLNKYQHNEEKIKELKETMGIQNGQVDHMSVENVSLRRRNAVLQKKLQRLTQDMTKNNPLMQEMSAIGEESVDSDFSIERAKELDVSSSKDYFSVGSTQKGKANKNTFPVVSSPNGDKAGE